MSRKNPYEHRLEPVGSPSTPASDGARDRFEPGPRDPFAKQPRQAPRQGNPAGVAGFAFSIVGLVPCVGMFIFPVSLAISALALKREPRGLAIAGVAVSLAAMLLHLALGAMMYFTFAVFGHGSAGDGFKLILDASIVRAEIDQRGSMPASLDELNLPADREKDPWGNAYFYEVFPDGGDYRLVSLGPDGALGTSDDVQLHPR